MVGDAAFDCARSRRSACRRFGFFGCRRGGTILFQFRANEFRDGEIVWRECLTKYGGPFLFGQPSVADAMYAPVCTRFQTYDVKLDAQCSAYCRKIMGLPFMVEWVEAAKVEPDELEELDAEF